MIRFTHLPYTVLMIVFSFRRAEHYFCDSLLPDDPRTAPSAAAVRSLSPSSGPTVMWDQRCVLLQHRAL